MNFRKTICILCTLTILCFAVNVPALAANNIFAGTLPVAAETGQQSPQGEALLSTFLGKPEKTSKDGYIIEVYEADSFGEILDALENYSLVNDEKVEFRIDLAGMTLSVYRWNESTKSGAVAKSYEKEPEQMASVETSDKPEATSAVCPSCGGLGLCDYCIGGMCDHCNGLGSVACNFCYGSGDCHSCYGLGVNAAGKSCSTCYGRGYCKHCFGSGEDTCTFCHGSGSCSFCYGSGICHICHGAG